MLQGIHLLDLARDYRLTLPRAWRDQFPDGEAMVTVAHDPAWLIYPTTFAAHLPYNRLAAWRGRHLGQAQRTTLDQRGRLCIPVKSRHMFGALSFPCSMALVGLGHWAELWRAEQWELEMDKMVNAPCPPWMQELMDNNPLM